MFAAKEHFLHSRDLTRRPYSFSYAIFSPLITIHATNEKIRQRSLEKQRKGLEPVRSFTAKGNHIGSVISKILYYTLHRQTTCYFYIRIEVYNAIKSTHHIKDDNIHKSEDRKAKGWKVKRAITLVEC